MQYLQHEWYMYDGILDGVFLGFEDGTVWQYPHSVMFNETEYPDFAQWIQCWSNNRLVFEV